MRKGKTYIIVEDEPLQLENLVFMLKSRLDLVFLGSFNNANAAYQFLSDEQQDVPDLMFLDIEMPQINGLQLLDSLSGLSLSMKVIIVTAYEEYAIPSYKYPVSGYLLKPVEMEQLNAAINKALNDGQISQTPAQESNASSPSFDNFFIKVDNKMVKMEIADIGYAEGANVYLKIYTFQDLYVTRLTLKYLEELLPRDRFMRVHDSFIVNLSCIKSFARNFTFVEIKLGPDKEVSTIPVGKKYRTAFKNWTLENN